MHKAKTSENITARRMGGLTPVGLDMRSIAKDVLGKRGFSNVDLIAHWTDVVGQALADGVKPDKITYPKSGRYDGVLHVRVQGGAFAVLLEHQKNIILDKVNTFLGYNAISDIKIRQDTLVQVPVQKPVDLAKELTPEQEALLQQRIKDIQDESLRRQLYEIGKKLFLK